MLSILIIKWHVRLFYRYQRFSQGVFCSVVPLTSTHILHKLHKYYKQPAKKKPRDNKWTGNYVVSLLSRSSAYFLMRAWYSARFQFILRAFYDPSQRTCKIIECKRIMIGRKLMLARLWVFYVCIISPLFSL